MTADHTEKNNSILKIALNLACACIISGVIIALVYYFTLISPNKNRPSCRTWLSKA